MSKKDLSLESRSDATPRLPEGVTAEDAERMGELANEDRRPSTRRVYRSKWRGFASFCAERDTEPLPASPEVVGAYLSKRSEEVSLSTIRQDVAAIRWMHERHGAEDPNDHSGVSRILDGINQTSDRTPEKKQAVLTEHVRAMVETLPLEEPQSDSSGEPGPAAVARHLRALRDRAIILVGYAGAFRRGELATIAAGDVTLNSDGMEIHVPKTKTEPRTIGINFARNADFCPVRTLKEWTGAAGIEEGPIFRAVPRSAEIAPDDEAESVSGKTVHNVIEDAKRMETNTSRDLGL